MDMIRQNPLAKIRLTSELRSGDFNERKRGRFKMKVPRPNVPPMVPNVEHPPVPLDTSQFNAYEGAGNKPYTLVVKTGQALRQHIKKAIENLGGNVLHGGYSDGSTTWSWLVQIPMTASKLQKALWGAPGLGSSYIAVREPSQEEFEESKIEKMIDNLVETKERRFRASIYVDIFIPETDDLEKDREEAKKVVDAYSEEVPNSYVGGVAEYNPHRREPLDREL